MRAATFEVDRKRLQKRNRPQSTTISNVVVAETAYTLSWKKLVQQLARRRRRVHEILRHRLDDTTAYFDINTHTACSLNTEVVVNVHAAQTTTSEQKPARYYYLF